MEVAVFRDTSLLNSISNTSSNKEANTGILWNLYIFIPLLTISLQLVVNLSTNMDNVWAWVVMNVSLREEAFLLYLKEEVVCLSLSIHPKTVPLWTTFVLSPTLPFQWLRRWLSCTFREPWVNWLIWNSYFQISGQSMGLKHNGYTCGWPLEGAGWGLYIHLCSPWFLSSLQYYWLYYTSLIALISHIFVLRIF